MREEDKRAFIEEYLDLCRRYGWCVEAICECGYDHIYLEELSDEYIEKAKGLT